MFSSNLRATCQRPISSVCFSTTCLALENAKQLYRYNKIMTKLLGKGKPRKTFTYNAESSEGTSKFLNLISGDKSSTKADHRVTVLNKVFMKNITDIMSTGEISPEICDRGIQISKVKVTPTFNQINVHWLASGTDDDNETQLLLTSFAPKLRHELSQLKVIGVVPKIEFIKDSSVYKYMTIENILKTADLGDDYERTPIGHDWKSEYQPQPCSKIEKTGDDKETLQESNESHEKSLPEMRMDVFGLKHDYIMSKINISVQKAKALHRRDFKNQEKFTSTVNLNDGNIGSIDAEERKKLFQEYFRKKTVERKVAGREERRSRPENILRQQELDSMYAEEFFKEFHEDFNEDDFDKNDRYAEDYYSKEK